MKPFTNRLAGAVAVILLIAGCGGTPDATTATEIDAIGEALDSADRMYWQITGLGNRLVVDCMSDADFDVHPAHLAQNPVHDAEQQEPGLMGSQPPEMVEFPTVAEARVTGVGWGVQLADDYVWTAQSEPEDPFHQMPSEYRDGYDEAYFGDESAGGCLSAVNDALVAATGHEMGIPDNPSHLYDPQLRSNLYQTDALHQAREDWSLCMRDRGHPYFEFESNTVDLRSYAATFHRDYDPDHHPAVIGYDPPPGAPWDYDEAMAREIELAVDVAECADETGLRDTMQSEWDAAMETIAIENDDVIFAYHDALKRSLEAAQSLLTE